MTSAERRSEEDESRAGTQGSTAHSVKLLQCHALLVGGNAYWVPDPLGYPLNSGYKTLSDVYWVPSTAYCCATSDQLGCALVAKGNQWLLKQTPTH